MQNKTNRLKKKSKPKRGANPYHTFYKWALLLGIAVLVGLTIYGKFSFWVNYLISINLAVLVLCGYDKSVAGSGFTRVPERVLHGIALVGGSVGLMLGMKWFRHKTQKGSFQFILGLIIIGQFVILWAVSDWLQLSLFSFKN